ncbi:hypothetical protein [Emcibacter sp.]|uniref:hypothetical protein n=1 Tax=Emcibacter sp. TaxID=1979954 RepID=UPI002AA7FBD2|nr:hypothetical protein [Emcibacter sp.]
MMKYLLPAVLFFLTSCGSAGTPPVTETPVSEPAVPEEAEPVPEPEPDPLFRVENIIGLSPLTVEGILGPAEVVRHEKDARIWMYKNSDCVIHLYFYENELGDLTLDYVDSLAADLSSPNPTVSSDACLDSFVIEDGALPTLPEEDISPQSPSYPYSGTDPQPDRPGS